MKEFGFWENTIRFNFQNVKRFYTLYKIFMMIELVNTVFLGHFSDEICYDIFYHMFNNGLLNFNSVIIR